jgi:hypothetical protein
VSQKIFSYAFFASFALFADQCFKAFPAGTMRR